MNIGQLTNRLSRGTLVVGVVATVLSYAYALKTTVYTPFDTPVASRFHDVRAALREIDSEDRILNPALEDSVDALTKEYMILKYDSSVRTAIGREDNNTQVVLWGLFGSATLILIGAVGAKMTKKYK